MRRTLALLLALMLASGCSNDADQPPPAATVPSEVTTSSTAPAAPDPAVIPDDLAEIDEAYVQAVVDELFAVDAKATEIFVTTKTLDERAIDYLEAIYVAEELDQQVDVWFRTLARGSDTLLPGSLGHEITRIINPGPKCVFVEAQRNYAKTTTQEVPPRPVYLGIVPKRETDDPEGLNPTAWVLFTDGFNADGSEPENPCAGF
jgi:hypothetical protein